MNNSNNTECYLDTEIIDDEEIIDLKPFDDDQYDSFFSLALADRFYSINDYNFEYDEYVEILYNFYHELGALYKFYEYSYRRFNRLLKEQQKEIDELLKEDSSAEAHDTFGDLKLIDKEYLLDVNHQTILLMLYTVFENMLKELVYYKSRKTGIEYKSGEKRSPVINQYIDFLRHDCKMQFSLDYKTRQLLTLMRKTRNYYVHDSHGRGAVDLAKYEKYSPVPVIKNGRMSIDYEYVISCFELIGKIADRVTVALISY